MHIGNWLACFRAMHEKAKGGALPPEDRRTYDAAREELARAMLAAQRVQARPGQHCRAALRVSRALQADLELPGGKVRALTLDLGAGGFGALLAAKPALGERARFQLRLPGGVQLSGEAKVVAVVPNAGSARVSFAFEGLAAADVERVETLVFDTILEGMKPEPPKAA